MLDNRPATILAMPASILEPMTTYGERLAEGLMRPGKTRVGLAQAMGVSPQAISALIRGVSKQATAENNVAAAAYLECDPNWLATGRGDPNWGRTPSAAALEVRESAPAYVSPATIGELVRNLGEQLSHLDELTRGPIAELLSKLASQPDEAVKISRLVESLARAGLRKSPDGDGNSPPPAPTPPRH